MSSSSFWSSRSRQTTFNSFTRLPCELRLQIWEAAAVCDPRDLVFLKNRPMAKYLIHGYAVATPPPSILHVCRESRDVGTRTCEKAFQDGSHYIWVNFYIDTIQVDYGRVLRDFPERHRIQHFRGVCRYDPDGDEPIIFQSFLEEFCCLKTIDLLCSGGDMDDWVDFADISFRCPGKNIRIILFCTGEYVDRKNAEEWRELKNSMEEMEHYMKDYSRKEALELRPSQFIPSWHRHCPVIR